MHQCYLKHGKKRPVLPAQWLESFQLALIQENLEDIQTLLLTLPKGKKEELVDMKNIIDATIVAFEEDKNETHAGMLKIKKQLAFLSQEEKKPTFLALT